MIRIGFGFDIHRFVEGRPLMLGGIEIPSDKGLEGHSDADVILHALTDALLGALGQGDIGTYFPDTDPQWKGAASSVFLEKAVALAQSEGFAIGNVDMTVLAEEPKLKPHREAIETSVAKYLQVDVGQVNLKASTMEKLGPIGEGLAMSAQVVVSLEKA